MDVVKQQANQEISVAGVAARMTHAHVQALNPSKTVLTNQPAATIRTLLSTVETSAAVEVLAVEALVVEVSAVVEVHAAEALALAVEDKE